MKRDQIRDFFFKEGLIRFDEQPCGKFNLWKDFDSGKYKAFIKAARISPGLKREDVLRNLNILSEEGMANGGVLLFSKRVPDFFLQASLSCILFQGTSKTKILDHTVFEGGIQENYDAATAYLQSHLNTEYVIRSGPRKEILELPEEALRESLLNAIAHRDYRATSSIQVNIYRDRVEIWNPGGLVSGLSLKDLGHVSRPRNLLLFSLMARMDLVENIGSGIKRIRDAISAYGLKPPLIQAEENWFSITFMRKGTHDAIEKGSRRKGEVKPPETKDIGRVNGGVSGGIDEGISEGIKALFDLIQATPRLRTPQISKALDVPPKTVERWLRVLKQGNRIEFRGSRRFGGYWIRETSGKGVAEAFERDASEGMDEGIKTLLNFIVTTPGLRVPQISKALDVPPKTVERWLRILKQGNRIEFRGSRRFGGYREKK